jgi:hypothetical protein
MNNFSMRITGSALMKLHGTKKVSEGHASLEINRLLA